MIIRIRLKEFSRYRPTTGPTQGEFSKHLEIWGEPLNGSPQNHIGLRLTVGSQITLIAEILLQYGVVQNVDCTVRIEVGTQVGR